MVVLNVFSDPRLLGLARPLYPRLLGLAGSPDPEPQLGLARPPNPMSLTLAYLPDPRLLDLAWPPKP